MGKLPAFLFYPKDWRNDTELLMCSRTARSVWIDMLCLMFFAPVRGVCSSGDGIPWGDQQIAAAIGGDIGTNLECIHELVSRGVAHRNDRGAIFSRRMVKDEQERQQTAKRVRKHRVTAHETIDVTHSVTADAGTATASEMKTEDAITKISEDSISEIYKHYPRKVGRGAAYREIGLALRRLLMGKETKGQLFRSLDDATVYLVQRTRLFASTPSGQAGEYTPHAATWFHQSRYLDDEAEWSKRGQQTEPSKTERRVAGNRAAILSGLGISPNARPSGADRGQRDFAGRSPALVGDVLRGDSTGD